MQPSDSVREWRSIPGYEGYYQVSDDGRVRSIPRTVPWNGTTKRMRGKELKPLTEKKSGYQTVSLVRYGRGDRRRVHQLVLESFVGPRPERAVTRHLNGVASDNRLENLRWGSQSQNMNDRVAHGTHRWANVTHCPKGHRYSDENTTDAKRGDASTFRQCKACRRDDKADLDARVSRAARDMAEHLGSSWDDAPVGKQVELLALAGWIESNYVRHAEQKQAE